MVTVFVGGEWGVVWAECLWYGGWLGWCLCCWMMWLLWHAILQVGFHMTVSERKAAVGSARAHAQPLCGDGVHRDGVSIIDR